MHRKLRPFYVELAKQEEGFGNINKLVTVLKETGFYPPFAKIFKTAVEPEYVLHGETYLMFASNNYLGLSAHERVKQAAKDAIDTYGISSGGSKIINFDIIRQLEAKIAELTRTEACLTFPTGYMANSAIFSAITNPFFEHFPHKSVDSVIFCDEYSHGSIEDGCALASARRVTFKHNNIDDLVRCIKAHDLPNKLIVTEGIFSLDGEIPNLPDYVEVARNNKAKLMVDDAHGVGILGKTGGGVGEHFNCSKDIDIAMGCMDKAMGGTGGYICGSESLIDYLRIASRPSRLSSAISCGVAGGVIEAIHQIQAGEQLRAQLFEKSAYLRKSLRDLGFTILGESNVPALPLYIGDDNLGIEFANMLLENKILCPIMRYPAVPSGKSRFRINVMVTHTKQHLDRFVEVCESIGEKLGMIS